ncbi:pilin [Succinimonas sp.]|uniref:pilin n=1 Tax=Succinimonas sp. TaxID=1936151 RepID=UPI00386A4F3A
MLCNNCGKEIGTDNFCPFCGANQTPQPSRNKPATSKKSSTCLIVGIVVGVLGFIAIAVIGIVAAIALPAYAKYMAMARFTEVTSAADGVRRQVELCFLETKDFSQCNNSMKGNNWRIGAKSDYATKYVANITVNKGVITAKAIDGNGLRGATFTIQPVPDKNSGRISWQMVPEKSSCFSEDLCGHSGR